MPPMKNARTPSPILARIGDTRRRLKSLLISDEAHCVGRHVSIFGIEPCLSNPATLNEKILARMIHDRSPLLTRLADKLAVRDHVATTAGADILVSLLYVYDRAEQIDFEVLPDRFVLKCTHDSGSAVVCLSKRNLDHDRVRRHLRAHMAANKYYRSREWQYRDIPARIVCESYFDVFRGRDPQTTPEMYRFHCFGGIPRYVEADFTHARGIEFINVYDMAWNLQPFRIGFPNLPVPVGQPAMLADMQQRASLIASGIDYCRVDLMASGDEVRFSEVTLTPASGRLRFDPPGWDRTLGDLWELGPRVVAAA